MKVAVSVLLFICALTFLHSADAAVYSYCYQAVFNTSVATSGDATSRKSEIETAANSIVNEFINGSIGFTASSTNATLTYVLGDGTKSEFVVVYCFVNVSKTAAELTIILQTFNITTTINGTNVQGDDFDECTNNKDQCSSLANCTNTDGSYSCSCPVIYADKSTNGIKGSICELPTNHTCNGSYVEVEAYLPYFTSLGINETELKLGNCSGIVSSNILKFSGSCSVVTEGNGTHIFYSWNLTNVIANPTVVIGNYVTIPITCSSLATGNASASITAIVSDAVQLDENLFLNQGASSIDIEVNAFIDSSFTNALSPGGAVTTDTKLSFMMGPTNGYLSPNVKTRCQSVSSQAAEGTGDSIQLIENGCKASNPNAQSLLDTVGVLNQGTGPQASFEVGAHFHSNSAGTRLSIEINICYDSGGGSACLGCISRRRRSIVNLVREKRQSSSSTIATGNGYFIFARADEDACNRDCGSGACVYDALRQQQCVCSVLATKDINGRCISSSEGDDVHVPIDGQDKTTLITVTTVSALLVLLVVAVAVGYLCFNKRSKA